MTPGDDATRPGAAAIVPRTRRQSPSRVRRTPTGCRALSTSCIRPAEIGGSSRTPGSLLALVDDGELWDEDAEKDERDQRRNHPANAAVSRPGTAGTSRPRRRWDSVSGTRLRYQSLRISRPTSARFMLRLPPGSVARWREEVSSRVKCSTAAHRMRRPRRRAATPRSYALVVATARRPACLRSITPARPDTRPRRQFDAEAAPPPRNVSLSGSRYAAAIDEVI